MQITLRLYQSDTDLILMRACEGRAFCSRVLECIAAYAEGRGYAYSFPVQPGGAQEVLPKSLKLNLHIRDSMYPALISFLGKYESGSRSALIKSLLRCSFTEYPSALVLQALGFSKLKGVSPAHIAESANAASECSDSRDIRKDPKAPVLEMGKQIEKEAVREEPGSHLVEDAKTADPRDRGSEHPECSGYNNPGTVSPLEVQSSPESGDTSQNTVKTPMGNKNEAPEQAEPKLEMDKNLFEMFLNM